uniref:hypothetical protein n=1 Tax=Picrophilus oshimae TaxID=46632 RepID=UPI00159C669B|nr:hypothetical protein [Picrophilus oshimae]
MTLDDIIKPYKILPPHKDGLWGRGYIEEFDPSKVGRPIDSNNINIVLNKGRPDLNHGDPHYDVIEESPITGNIYHNRIYKP